MDPVHTTVTQPPGAVPRMMIETPCATGKGKLTVSLDDIAALRRQFNAIEAGLRTTAAVLGAQAERAAEAEREYAYRLACGCEGLSRKPYKSEGTWYCSAHGQTTVTPAGCPCCSAAPYKVDDCNCPEPCEAYWCQARDPEAAAPCRCGHLERVHNVVGQRGGRGFCTECSFGSCAWYEAAKAAAPAPVPLADAAAAPVPLADAAAAIVPLTRSQLRGAMAAVAYRAPDAFRAAVAEVTAPDLGEQYWEDGEGGPLAGQDPSPELPPALDWTLSADGRSWSATRPDGRTAVIERLDDGVSFLPRVGEAVGPVLKGLVDAGLWAQAYASGGARPEVPAHAHQWDEDGDCLNCGTDRITAAQAGPGGGGVLFPAGCDPDAAVATVTPLPLARDGVSFAPAGIS